MANFKLDSKVKESIIAEATIYADRCLTLALSTFPLNDHDIERGLNGPEALACIRNADQFGYLVGASLGDSVPLRFTSATTPGVDRALAVSVYFTRRVYRRSAIRYGIGVQAGVPAGEIPGNELIQEWMDPAKLALVAPWAARVVRAGRAKKLVKSTVAEVVEHCSTTGHVLALWPTLVTISGTSYWQARFRNKPKSLRAYAPTVGVMNLLAQRIAACDSVITQGMMLPARNTDAPMCDGVKTIELGSWEMRPTDPPFTC